MNTVREEKKRGLQADCTKLFLITQGANMYYREPPLEPPVERPKRIQFDDWSEEDFEAYKQSLEEEVV